MKILTLILLLLFSPSINAYQLLYDPVAKLNRDTPILYNHAGAPSWLTKTTVRDMIQRGIADWRERCGVRFLYGGTTTAVESDDGLFVISWGPISWDAAAYVVGSADMNQNGEWRITDADMVIDPGAVYSASQLEQLILHELGHVLGLNHSEYNDAVMSGPPLSWYNTIDSLTWDDVQGCRALYGR